MRRVYSLFLLFFIGIYSLCMVGCSESDDGPSGGSLMLTADKQGVIADGRDTVYFTVVDEQQTNLTGQCRFVVNGVRQDASFYVAQKAGRFDVMAEYNSTYSNKITLLAEAPEVATFKIESDKTKLFADAADCMRLKLVTKSGTDITSKGRFYVDGTELPSRYFGSENVGMHTITATYDGLQVPMTLPVQVVEQATFTDRVLIEMLTGTWCGQCAPFIISLDQWTYGFTSKDGVYHPGCSQFVPIMIHAKDKYAKEPEQTAYFKMFNAPGYPTAVLDRKTPWNRNESVLRGSILSVGGAGISIDARIEGQEVVVVSGLRGKDPIEGRYVVALVEDGIMDTQTSVNGIIEHHDILRQMTSIEGTAVSIPADRALMRTDRLSLAGFANTANCKVVVFIIDGEGSVPNVQVVPVGERIGY